MTVRVPYLQVFGPSSRNLVPGLGGALKGVTITDQEGNESDECVISVSDNPPYNVMPPKGTKYRVKAGWQSGGGGSIGGIYAFETYRKILSPDDGRVIELVCRAADFIDKMKETKKQHYDKENGFGTAGKIFEDLAKEGGVTAAIDPEIAKIEIPYKLRWNQSAIDFATDLADEIGVVVKPQMDRLVVREKGKGKSVGGSGLSALIIDYDQIYEGEFEIDPRPLHREVTTPWFDPDEGKAKQVIEASKGRFARAALMHPARSEKEARKAAKAAGTDLTQASGTGSVSMAGDGAALAGAPVKPVGFGDDISNLEWEVSSATHTIIPEDGWLVDVELQAGDGGAK